jgi:hypothetical protein
MTGNRPNYEGLDEAPEEDIAEVYGSSASAIQSPELLAEQQKNFAPWHHPVKQIVRERQWIALTQKLLREREVKSTVLRYFTLPGKDLFDIKLLADACAPSNVRIEYFGFNSAAPAATVTTAANGNSGLAPWVNAESALRQAGRITPEAIIHPDRLEDIAVNHSHASLQLRQRPPFDIINIDGCDHLAYAPPGRDTTTFDALKMLLAHQMGMKLPWLLFLTTRVDPNLLGDPGIYFNKAINDNLSITGSGFGKALAECLEAEQGKLMTELSSAWNTRGTKFLKLYTIGLSKFLLQFFCGQPNLPANVELASVYAYRVSDDNPDMLALAFRIIPDRQRVFAPSIGGATLIPSLEPIRAVRIAERAKNLWDIDNALQDDEQVRTQAVIGSEKLLGGANYNIAAWRNWLAQHEKRPLVVQPT